jgi:hypothetical protein
MSLELFIIMSALFIFSAYASVQYRIKNPVPTAKTLHEKFKEEEKVFQMELDKKLQRDREKREERRKEEEKESVELQREAAKAAREYKKEKKKIEDLLGIKLNNEWTAYYFNYVRLRQRNGISFSEDQLKSDMLRAMKQKGYFDKQNNDESGES